MPGPHLLDAHPELRVLVEKELVGGGEVRHSLLQLLQLGPQLQVLILTVERKYLARRIKIFSHSRYLQHLERMWRRPALLAHHIGHVHAPAVVRHHTSPLVVMPPVIIIFLSMVIHWCHASLSSSLLLIYYLSYSCSPSSSPAS